MSRHSKIYRISQIHFVYMLKIDAIVKKLFKSLTTNIRRLFDFYKSLEDQYSNLETAD